MKVAATILVGLVAAASANPAPAPAPVLMAVAAAAPAAGPIATKPCPPGAAAPAAPAPAVAAAAAAPAPAPAVAAAAASPAGPAGPAGPAAPGAAAPTMPKIDPAVLAALPDSLLQALTPCYGTAPVDFLKCSATTVLKAAGGIGQKLNLGPDFDKIVTAGGAALAQCDAFTTEDDYHACVLKAFSAASSLAGPGLLGSLVKSLGGLAQGFRNCADNKDEQETCTFLSVYDIFGKLGAALAGGK